ncbi:MAG: rRNA pseudouridine synthase [Deltaproteobacteria bacterium]|nr:rRNA pseudouridine synthase [Deltaproteobacteria bacterium]
MNTRSGKVSLERALSKLGLASRGETRKWILAGRLKVNGRIIKDPLYRVVPEKDKFALDEKILRSDPWRTIIFYKPKGVVITKSDERGRRTVFDLLPHELKNLHPVGRLDMATTGLLLLTNDTRLSAYLTDPVNAVPRTYVVTVRGMFTNEKLKQAEQGIFDNGELLKSSKITLRKASNKESHLIVELTEGKNRELRRLFKSLGNEITHLKRVAFGNLTLDDNMQPGEFRHLTKEDFPLCVKR